MSWKQILVVTLVQPTTVRRFRFAPDLLPRQAAPTILGAARGPAA